MSKFFSKLFFPPRAANEFSLQRYITAIESGEFRDLFNLGVCETGGGTWLLKDFTQEPNALFVGTMGSGKSYAACFTLATWLASNSDRTICFIADASKGANDYSALFKYDQVYPITSDGGRNAPELIGRVIDMVFSEAMARKDLFNENQSISIKDYEVKTGKSMARIVVMLEEFHSIPYNIWEFDKNFKKSHTIANKFHQLMRIGRSFGIFFCAASQKSTKSDIPTEVVPNFTQKQIFKVSLGEATYVLGRPEPAQLTSAQKGRCYTEYGAVQFPYLPKETQSIILDRFVKPLDANCAYLTPELIMDYLDGKSPKELYRLKKMSELAEALESFDGELVLQIIHEKIGNQVERVDSKIDNFGVCMIITTPNGERKTVMYLQDSKIGHKTLDKLSSSILYHKCSGALLYCLGENFAHGVYRSAGDRGIKIYDHEDIKLISRQIDAGKIENAILLETQLANTDEIPYFVSKDDIRHANDPYDSDLIHDVELPEFQTESRVDHDDLSLVLLGEDPAVLRALNASRRRKSLDTEAKANTKKKKPDSN
jgi:hypothetical protein